MNVNTHLTVTDIRADAHKDFCGINEAMTVVVTDGKLITKQPFPRVVAITFLIARYCVYPATKRPILTADTKF